MEEIYSRLKHHYSYAYWCKEAAPKQQILWWKGYLECLSFVIELVRTLRKEEKK